MHIVIVVTIIDTVERVRGTDVIRARRTRTKDQGKFFRRVRGGARTHGVLLYVQA